MKINPREWRAVTLCYPFNRRCQGRSYSSYNWTGKFYSWPKERPVDVLSETFYPNPAEKPLDEISEVHPIKSSHGRIAYEQIVCPQQDSACVGKLYIGLRAEP